MVEHGHSTAVSDWRVRSDNTVPKRRAGVDSVRELSFPGIFPGPCWPGPFLEMTNTFLRCARSGYCICQI